MYFQTILFCRTMCFVTLGVHFLLLLWEGGPWSTCLSVIIITKVIWSPYILVSMSLVVVLVSWYLESVGKSRNEGGQDRKEVAPTLTHFYPWSPVHVGNTYLDKQRSLGDNYLAQHLHKLTSRCTKLEMKRATFCNGSEVWPLYQPFQQLGNLLDTPICRSDPKPT